MLIVRPHRVFIVPIGGMLALLGLGLVALVDGLTQVAGGRMVVPCAVVALGILVHVLTSFARVKRSGGQLRWRAFLASGEAQASACELIAKFDARPGHAPNLDLNLVRDGEELVEILSVPATPEGELEASEIAGALGIGWTRRDIQPASES